MPICRRSLPRCSRKIITSIPDSHPRAALAGQPGLRAFARLVILMSAVGLRAPDRHAPMSRTCSTRAVGRRGDRDTVGAGRDPFSAPARQFLTESVLLGGSAVRRVAAGIRAVKIRYAAYPTPSRDWPLHQSARRSCFRPTASPLASIPCGSIPATQPPTRTADGAGRGRPHLRYVTPSARCSSLVIAEVALAMMLLAAAGLLIRSFTLLQRVDPGFDTSHLAITRLSLPDSRYPEVPERTQFVNSVLERLHGLPGVQAVAASGTLPFDPVPETDVDLEGHVYEPGNEPSAEILTVSPEYFGAMGIRLLAGRTFTPQDIPGHPAALVVNQTMAQHFWPGESPLGKRVVMKDWGPPLPGQIVGVVSDVKQDSLETNTQPAIYYSFAQFSQGTLTTYLIVRGASDPLRLAPAIRDQIWSVDRDQPVTVLAMDQIISGSLERRRFVLTLLATFAALALLLAVVGIYGVIAYSVGQQTHEFGIRMALGAQRYQLLLMVLRQTVRKLAVGLAIGIAGAVILTRLMASLLFGISATDPLTFSLAALLLLTAALIASFIPARRAATVNPMSALRNE